MRAATPLLLLTVIVAAIFLLNGEMKQRQVLRNIGICTGVRTGIDSLENLSRDEIEKVAFQATADPITLNQLFAQALRKLPSDLGFSDMVPASGLILDAWGRPLLFASTNSSVYGRLPANVNEANRRIVVWSAGPDGKNEWGQGDDKY